MGVLNVTPDSFSDGGRFLDPDRAVEHALEMEAAGADDHRHRRRVDPPARRARGSGRGRTRARHAGAASVSAGRLRVPISIDTRKAAVARVALDAGAAIINDMSALEADPAMAPLAAASQVRGDPDAYARRAADHMKFARYRDVVGEVDDLSAARARARDRARESRRSRIILDPGLGFAKNRAHNLELLGALPRLCALGYPVLVGASRKSFVRAIAGANARTRSNSATAAVNAIAIAAGASIVRVHDPGPAAAAVRMAAAIKSCGDGA